MGKMSIKIESHEDKTSKTGTDYSRFKTSDGWMSAFESDVIEDLKKHEGQVCQVEVAVNEEKGFKNIRDFYGVSDDSIATVKIADMDKEMEKDKLKIACINSLDSDNNKHATMYVSYAKDVFIAMLDNGIDSKNAMEQAIALVKQAKDAFE